MLGVDAEITHAAVFAVEFDHSLPVDRLVQVHVAGMTERGAHLDDLTEFVVLYPADKLLTAGEVREFAGAADCYLGMIAARLKNGGVGFGVDTEGLFAEQMLAGVDNIAVELLVKIMRNSAVDSVDFGIVKKPAVVGFIVFDRVEITEKPFLRLIIGVAERDDFGTGDVLGQMTPACGGGSKFASHKTASDNTETDSFAHFTYLFYVMNYEYSFIY